MIYLNGAFMPLEEARIPVLDRGFIFGDGIYEVIPVYSRRPFRLSAHLRRLQNSLDAISLANPHTDATWTELITQLVAHNSGEDQYLYLHITRGVAKRDHAFPPHSVPTVFMMSSVLTPPDAALKQQGLSAITTVDNRWLRCDIKSVSLLPNVLLRQTAVAAGAAEAILIRDGFMTEGAASNIFVVRDGVILAPPKNNLMLPGITYDLVLELAESQALPTRVAPVAESELRQADEIWLTSSTREVLPITQLDGQPVGKGDAGPMFQRMDALYQNFKATTMREPSA